MLSETKHLYFHASEMFRLKPQRDKRKQHDKQRAKSKKKELRMRKQNRQINQLFKIDGRLSMIYPFFIVVITA